MKILNNTPAEITVHEHPDELSDDQHTQKITDREEPDGSDEALATSDEDFRRIFYSSDDFDDPDTKPEDKKTNYDTTRVCGTESQ